MQAVFKRFRDDQDGVVSVELLFAVPILMWVLMSTFVYFDAFKSQTISTRAALTVADMISREEQCLSRDYLEGTRNLLRALSEVDDDPDFRVTVFRYREAQDDLQRRWSRNRGYGRNLNNNNMNSLRDAGRIPPLANNEYAILLETRTAYNTIANTTWWGPVSRNDQDQIEFETFTVIKPRYASQVCFDPTPDNPDSGDEVR
ncbi:MAG: hypothetical protein AAFQ09_05175 [Pseudomonadota bacterium]